MATLSPQQIAQYAYNAGFRGNALNIAVAVSLAESGGNTTATNHNTNGTTDYGLWQINSVHSQYSPTLLFNPDYNASAAWDLSSHGVNWQPWTTYNTGAYLKYMSQATQATTSGGGSIQQAASATPAPAPIPAWCQPFMAHSMQWWEQNGNHFPTSGEGSAEGGVDWTPNPNNLPITALLPGVVVGAGYFCKPISYCRDTWQNCNGAQGFGVITIRSNNPLPNLVPGNQIDIYYQHILIDPSIHIPHCDGSFGESVAQGQRIGQANGSFNVEVGVNIGSQWGGIWGKNSPGPHVDPIPFLYTLISSGVAGSSVGLFGGGLSGPYVPLSYTALTSQVHQTLINTPGFYGIALAVDEAEQFPGWVNLAEGITDFQGIARSIGATVSDNFTPFIIRSGLVAIGTTLLILLMIKPIEGIARVVA